MSFQSLLLKSVSAVLCVTVLSACGSGGGSTTSEDLPPTETRTAGLITDFLWKPQSDAHSRSPGTLAILVSACEADVRVNGVSLTFSGPSNGRCTTSRGFNAGCSYGTDVRVEVFDTVSGLPYAFPSGDPFYLVTNGCNREEFRG